MQWRPLYDKIMVGGAEAAAGVLLWVFVAWSWKRQRRSYAVYSLLTTGIFTCMNFWCSLPRYALCVFPLYLGLAEAFDGDDFAQRVALGACGLLQFAGMAVYVSGWWAF